MKLVKKILLSFGVVASVAAPIIATVSCGTKNNDKSYVPSNTSDAHISGAKMNSENVYHLSLSDGTEKEIFGRANYEKALFEDKLKALEKSWDELIKYIPFSKTMSPDELETLDEKLEVDHPEVVLPVERIFDDHEFNLSGHMQWEEYQRTIWTDLSFNVATCIKHIWNNPHLHDLHVQVSGEKSWYIEDPLEISRNLDKYIQIIQEKMNK